MTAEGTQYVVEQLGLALKNMETQLAQVTEYAKGLEEKIKETEPEAAPVVEEPKKAATK